MSDDQDSSEGSLKNMLIRTLLGLALTIMAFPVLMNNEKHSVERYKVLNQAQKDVIEITIDKIDPQNQSKLILAKGLATTNETIVDKEFGVKVNAIKLKKTVLMYQWHETKDTEHHRGIWSLGRGDHTTSYSYKQDWYDYYINSNNFNDKTSYKNPASFLYKSNIWVAEKVTLGKFILANQFIDQIAYKELKQLSDPKYHDPSIKIPTDFKLLDNMYYMGVSPDQPQIGDIKIVYKIVEPSEVTITGKQNEQKIEPFILPEFSDDDRYLSPITKIIMNLLYRGCDLILGEPEGQSQALDTIELLHIGDLTKQQMFNFADDQNSYTTWLLRLAGFLMIYIGIMMLFSIISRILDYIPFLGEIFEAGLNFIALSIALISASATIAFSWLMYRPAMAAATIAASLVIVVLIYKCKKQNIN